MVLSNKKMVITFEGQKIELKCGIVGGIMNDFTKAPMGMYYGKLNVLDANLALVHLLRAVLKLCTEELKMDPIQAGLFCDFALREALLREEKNKNIDNATLDQHEIILKMRRDEN